MKNEIVNINLTDCIGQSYYKVFWDIEDNKNLHYFFKGGRGSLKSSFVFIYIIWAMTRDYLNGEVTHTVGLRKVKDTIKDSIFNNLLWAIEILGVGDLWEFKNTPMRIYLKDGGGEIIFRGCANQRDYEKIKSIKFKKGKVKYAVFEELTEYSGLDEILSILQSLFRGTDTAKAFYMYNPPASRNNWVNKEVKIKRPNRFVHFSTYLQAPKKWLGDIFIKEAETLKKVNPRKYNHMYMGEETGEGLEIYPVISPENKNGVLEFRTITDEEIKEMTKIDRGLDFGYTHASCYSECYYDMKNQIVYVIDEVYLYQANNFLLATEIKKKSGSRYINGDNEDPRTINEMNGHGLNVGKALKGKDSKSHGIKWLQDRAKIIIDKKRTPNIAYDFETYEFKKDKDGNIVYDYPEEPDGSASVRYALEKYILRKELVFGVER